VVDENFESYLPFQVIRFPSHSSPRLKVLVRKRLNENVRYETTFHRENVLTWEAGIGERCYVAGAFSISPYILFGNAGLVVFPLVYFSDWVHDFFPRKEPKYERIPNSEWISESFRTGTRDVPAASQTVIARQSDTVRTDQQGCAEFHIQPTECETAIEIHHVESGSTYLLQRVRREREVKEAWFDKAKTISNVLGITVTIVNVGRKAALGASTGAILVALVIDLVTGAVIGYLFDEVLEGVGTKTVSYYEWLFVRRP